MNRYLESLRKIEFVVTERCTGRCRHCSAGGDRKNGCSIDPTVAVNAVRAVAALYPIETVMAFGGEPLLRPETTVAIMRAASDAGVRHRQVITNGFFTKNRQRAERVAAALADAGVNDLLLSVDAFHEETIPLASVYDFAGAVISFGIPVRLSPAWLVGREADNPYNCKTRAIIDAMSSLGIEPGQGHVIFPEGNALIHLKEYFTDKISENPYIDDPKNITCFSVSANGDVLGSNLYREDPIKILQGYRP